MTTPEMSDELAALARSEPPTGEPVAISRERIRDAMREAGWKHNDLRKADVGKVTRVVNTLLAEARAPGAVPEGWKLVPIEPTRAMCLAAQAERKEYPIRSDADSPVVLYRAMLTAAPPIEAQAGEPKP